MRDRSIEQMAPSLTLEQIVQELPVSVISLFTTVWDLFQTFQGQLSGLGTLHGEQAAELWRRLLARLVELVVLWVELSVLGTLLSVLSRRQTSSLAGPFLNLFPSSPVPGLQSGLLKQASPEPDLRSKPSTQPSVFQTELASELSEESTEERPLLKTPSRRLPLASPQRRSNEPLLNKKKKRRHVRHASWYYPESETLHKN